MPTTGYKLILMDYNDKALEGFQLVLNNKWHLAQSIFMKHK